jgi:tetratricopeptide (TPR) repeat protein
VAALLSLAFLVAACVEPPRDVSLAERGADALEAGDYMAAEQFLGDALGHNPDNEYALLNLGVVYQDTGRPELARRTYAEIIRINRQERAALIVARKSVSLSPMVLARENLADLNLSPAIADSGTPPPSWFGNNAPIDSRNFSALYSDMSAVFYKLQGLAESMRLMSDTLRAAAREAERQQASANKAKPADAAMAMKDMASQKSADKNAGDAPAAAMKTNDGDAQTMAPADKKGDDMGAENGDEQAVARAEPVNGDGPSVRVHIASFRSEEGAERGWQILKKSHPALLGEFDAQIREIDFGAGMGVFFRVQAGPLNSEHSAKQLCERLKSRGLYCAVAFF